MYKQERHRQIREYITEHKQADVQTLSSLLGVSGATIRTDLNELEKAGFIVRFHGGAALNSAGYHDAEISLALRGSNVEYNQNKAELGKIASHLIQDPSGAISLCLPIICSWPISWAPILPARRWSSAGSSMPTECIPCPIIWRRSWRTSISAKLSSPSTAPGSSMGTPWLISTHTIPSICSAPSAMSCSWLSMNQNTGNAPS